MALASSLYENSRDSSTVVPAMSAPPSTEGPPKSEVTYIHHHQKDLSKGNGQLRLNISRNYIPLLTPAEFTVELSKVKFFNCAFFFWWYLIYTQNANNKTPAITPIDIPAIAPPARPAYAGTIYELKMAFTLYFSGCLYLGFDKDIKLQWRL